MADCDHDSKNTARRRKAVWVAVGGHDEQTAPGKHCVSATSGDVSGSRVDRAIVGGDWEWFWWARSRNRFVCASNRDATHEDGSESASNGEYAFADIERRSGRQICSASSTETGAEGENEASEDGSKREAEEGAEVNLGSRI